MPLLSLPSPVSRAPVWEPGSASRSILRAPTPSPLCRKSSIPGSKHNLTHLRFVNQLYQNWAVSRFASVVPQKDIALLTPNGQTYDTAYGLYLDNVFIQIPNDPAVEAKINETAAKLTRFRTEIAALKKQAQLDYKSDCPNGIDA